MHRVQAGAPAGDGTTGLRRFGAAQRVDDSAWGTRHPPERAGERLSLAI